MSRVRDEKLDLNGHIQRQLEETDRSWTEWEEQRQFAGRKQMQKVRALRPITWISDETPAHRQIAVHIVGAIQSHLEGSPILDKHGKDISRTDYITSLAPGRYGVKVRSFYRGRWGIENQGFRSLSQTWDIDRPAGHSYAAVLARLVFVFLSTTRSISSRSKAVTIPTTPNNCGRCGATVQPSAWRERRSSR